MLRSIVCVGVICCLTTDLSASLHTLRTSGDTADTVRLLTPGGKFELQEKPDESGYQYKAENPLQIEITNEGAPIPLELQFVAVENDSITMQFNNRAAEKELQLVFNNTGTMVGDPVPANFSGRADWTRPGSETETSSLGGYSDASVTVIPEPSPWALGVIAITLLGVGRIIQRPLWQLL